MKRYYQSGQALGCLVELCLVDTEQSNAEILLKQLWDEVACFSDYFSRFNAQSELSVFNKNAGQKIRVSDDFSKMLLISKDYANKTNGLFNIFLLPALQKAGYVHSFHEADKTDQSINFSDRQVVDMALLEVDQSFAKIPKNTAIDLGGIGKGFLANKLADFVEPKVPGFWFSLGGDIICGGKDELGENWNVDLIDADSNRIGYVASGSLKRLAAATSGITKRRGDNWHHIIDPRTNKPTENKTAIVTVIDSDIIKADILATCSIIETIEKSKAMLFRFGVVDALFRQIDQHNKYHLTQINDIIEPIDTSIMERFDA